ncbi:PIN domain-like protein [Lentinula edodes]|uniref:PIN domain-like protein n=1 Tax=Lentinula edodes TaxID=5353 RepID=A0A1Q3DWX4_LENED|nr:PIN domain-like protein [Lentinula edodes]
MSAFKPILVLENSGSVARDHLALERTFLAYVRTSLAIASTGVALVQLFTVSSNSTSNIQSYAQPLGSTSVCLGIVVLLIGLIRYFTVQTALTQGKFPVSRLMIGGIVLILLAIVTTVFVVLIAGRRKLEVIKRLPDRLQGFSGKKIVLDGTLLTQRFHFAQIPHPRRHVLGWYRLIKELEQYSVEAICVFDGKGRNLAKAQEALRRKNAQRLAAARAVIENERLSRLNRISSAVRNIAKFSLPQKVQVSSALEQLALKHSDKSESGKKGILSLIKKSTMEDVDLENLSWIDSESWTVGNPAENDFMQLLELRPTRHRHASYGTTSVEVEEALRTESSVVAGFPSMASSEQFSELPPESSSRSKPFVEDNIIPSSSKTSTVDDVLSTLTPLFLEYQDSLVKVASNPMHAAKASISHPDTDISTDSDDAVVNGAELEAGAAQEVYEMSKRQCQLTLQEGEFWDSLTSTLGSEPQLAPVELHSHYEGEAHHKMLQELTHKMRIRMSSSTKRPSFATSLVVTNPSSLSPAPNYAQCSTSLDPLGPTRALDFIRAHGSIEKVIEAETRFKPKVSREDYLKQVNMARKVFQTLPPIPEDAVVKSRDGFGEGISSRSDAGQVLFIMGKYGLSREIDCDSEDALRGNDTLP